MSPSPLTAPRRLLLILSIVVVGLVVAPPLAHAAASWQSGPLVEVQDSNCITGQIEYEAGTYLSYFADPANPPQVGQVYYVALDIAGIGDTCSGAYGSFELSMPSGTAPAISAANPVRCYLKPRTSNTYTNVAGNCPQSLQVGPHGYYLNPTNTNPPFWPVVQGDAVEVQVPVVSSAPLNGTDQFHAFVQLADGETDPFMAPSLLAIVNPSGSQNVSGTNKQIGIVYANPTITGQTTNGNSTVNANFLGYVENNSNPGTAYAELAKADAAGDCTSPVLFNPTIKSNVASLQNPQTQITGTWTTLYPGGAYCFRIVATVSSGPQAGTYYGNWQYFATQGSFLSNAGTSQYVPPVAHPITGTGCSSGAGCATSNCATGSSCNQTGSVSGAAHVLTVTRAGTGIWECRQRLVDHVPERVLADLPDGSEGATGDADRNTGRRVDVCGLERRWLLGDGSMHGLDDRRPGGDRHVHAHPEAAATSASAPSAAQRRVARSASTALAYCSGRTGTASGRAWVS